MKTKVSKIEKVEPISIDVFYHHFKDVTVLRVVRTYDGGTTSVDCARTTSPIYHYVEKRAIYGTAHKCTFEHIVHNCNYETI